jgi:glycosyltransferase involved in cell wall biosynthesis
VRPVYPPVQVSAVSQQEKQAFREKFNIQPGQRLIGMAARLATEKGAEYLACALPKILQAHPQARVLFVGPYQNIVGEEAYAQKVNALIEPLKNRWTFLGIVSPQEMAAFFHESEVTVLPSINSTESYGIVQVESMTCGTPVVATNLPGVRVPVFETGMGQVVPLADSDKLAEAIIEILDQPENFRGQPEMIVPLSTPEAVALEYENIYNELLSPHPFPSINEVEFHTNPVESKTRQ